MAGEFEGKVVVVSGGSRGIGRAIAVAFAREGAQTVLAASSAANLAEGAKAVAAVGPAPMTIAGDLRTLAGCEQVFAEVRRAFPALRRAGQQCRRHQGRQIPRAAGRGLERRLRAQVPRRGAADAAVLAAAQGGAWQCRQHRRRRRAHAGAGLPDRRRGQRGDGEFRQGPHRARQSRRHQHQRHPSRADADRARRAVVRAIRQGAEQDGRAGARGGAGEERPAPHRPARGRRRAGVCSWGAPRRATSTAPRSPSMAAARRVLFVSLPKGANPPDPRSLRHGGYSVFTISTPAAAASSRLPACGRRRARSASRWAVAPADDRASAARRGTRRARRGGCGRS